MFAPFRSLSQSRELSKTMSEDENGQPKVADAASPETKVKKDLEGKLSDAAADALDESKDAGESTPLVGKKVDVVIKDEHEKATVESKEVNEDGTPPKNFLQIVQEVAAKTGEETVKFGQAVGQKTKEITDHVGKESMKIHENIKPHMQKLGEDMDREGKKHQERARALGENIGKSTKDLSDNIGRESVKIAKNVGEQTKVVTDNIGRESVKIATNVSNTTKQVADHVGKESVKIATVVGEETKKQYSKVAPIVEPHAKKYSAMVNGTMPEMMTGADDPMWKQLLDGTARAFGRVLLCDNPFTGAMVSLSLLFGSPVAFLVTLYCAALTNLTSKYMNLDQSMMRRGVFASNAVLVGAGLSSYFIYEGVWGLLSLILIATLAAPATLLAYLFTARILSPVGIPCLFFPYVGVMMFTLLGASYFKAIMPAPIEIVDASRFRLVEATFKGMAQIFVVDSGFSGFLIFLGMLACSRILAAAAFVGSFLAGLLALAFFGVPVELINAGLFGFNSALTIPALLYYLIPTKKSLIACVAGLFLTLGAQAAFESLFLTWSIPAMVIPFCFAMLPFVALDLSSISGAEEPFVKLIPLDELSTPEDHLRKYKEESGYEEVPDVDEEAPAFGEEAEEAEAPAQNGELDV